jgi:hypothetical protein
MTTYAQHWHWWQVAAEIPERWSGSIIDYDSQPSDEILTEMRDRSWGPDDAPPYPQAAATDETIESMEEGWRRLIAKARQDVAQMRDGTYDLKRKGENDGIDCES